MLSIKALEDGAQQELQYTGTLKSIGRAEPFFSVLMRKKVEMPGMGSYIKDEAAPCYGLRYFRKRLAEEEEADMPCLGAVYAGSNRRPAQNYVMRRIDYHSFCLPVYPAASVSGGRWKPAGYLVCDRGYLVLVERRVWPPILLAVFLALWFLMCYGMYTMGLHGLWQYNTGSMYGLWQTLHAYWDGFWTGIFG